MLKRIVTFFLGSWGMEILRFYIANSMWINAAVILYMLVLTIAYVNYRAAKISVMEILEKDVATHPRKKKFTVRVEELQLSKPVLPVISAKLSFVPSRYSIEKIEALLNADEEVRKLREGILIELI